jgi:hypothetical protein
MVKAHNESSMNSLMKAVVQVGLPPFPISLTYRLVTRGAFGAHAIGENGLSRTLLPGIALAAQLFRESQGKLSR